MKLLRYIGVDILLVALIAVFYVAFFHWNLIPIITDMNTLLGENQDALLQQQVPQAFAEQLNQLAVDMYVYLAGFIVVVLLLNFALETLKQSVPLKSYLKAQGYTHLSLIIHGGVLAFISPMLIDPVASLLYVLLAIIALITHNQIAYVIKRHHYNKKQRFILRNVLEYLGVFLLSFLILLFAPAYAPVSFLFYLILKNIHFRRVFE